MKNRISGCETTRILPVQYCNKVVWRSGGQWVQEDHENADELFNASVPWKLTVDFDTLHHLFSGSVATSYKVDGYSCSCGHTDFVVRQPDQALNYRCRECGNSSFYSANRAQEKLCRFLDENPDLTLWYRYEISYDEYFAVHLSTQIPVDIDFTNKRFLYTSKKVFTKKMPGFDARYVYETSFQDDPWIYAELDKLYGLCAKNEASLFHLNHWTYLTYGMQVYANVTDALAVVAQTRKEKSVKRAVFDFYERHKSLETGANLFYVELFCRKFSDPNIVVRLLDLNYSMGFQPPFFRELAKRMVDFLLRRYTEKQVSRFLIQAVEDTRHISRDVFRLFGELESYLDRHCCAVRCTLDAIHDEFLRCHDEKQLLYVKTLIFDRHNESVCHESDDYSVNTPKTGRQLIQWGETLQNCLSIYGENIKEGNCDIYGFFRDDKLEFAVEVSNASVVQASRTNNAELTENQEEVLRKWCDVNMIEWHKILIT